MTTAAFEYLLYLAKPPAEVWRAITEKPLIDRYYLAPLRELTLQRGGTISYGEGRPLIEGIVVECAPFSKLVHTFRFVDLPDAESIVNYEIALVGETMTALTIRHEGLCPEGQTYANVVSGWAAIASSLKTLLETGQPLPWPKR